MRGCLPAQVKKCPGCLILLNKRDEAACLRLHGPCRSLFLFLFFFLSRLSWPLALITLLNTLTRSLRKQEVPDDCLFPISLFVVSALIHSQCVIDLNDQSERRAYSISSIKGILFIYLRIYSVETVPIRRVQCEYKSQSCSNSKERTC